MCFLTEPNRKPVPAGGIGAAVAAATERARSSLLRNHGGGHAPVSNLELFFDLVYVFAITQLSHFIGHHFGWIGVIEGLILFLAVWWVWIFTAWVTNWANPDRVPIRVLLLTLMFFSLVLAIALPGAFADQAKLFACCYIALQLGRTLAMVVIFRNEGRGPQLNMVRIAIYFATSAPFWLAGAWLGGGAQIGLWLAALAIECIGPLAMFKVPGLSQSTTQDWNISGSHMAERCALFIIIALGEGIVVSAATFSEGPADAGRIAALVTAFTGSALVWWLYFDIGAERGAQLISGHEQAGRIARNAYTYLHMPIVLGIVIFAVGDALLLEDWSGIAGRPLILTQLGGAVLFLAGLAYFKRYSTKTNNLPFSHGLAIMLNLVLALVAWFRPMPALLYAELCVVILLIAAVWEWGSYHGGWMERMEARGWKLGGVLRQRTNARRERLGIPID
ncbi:MAG: low temperature requirement protein A [Proteobacteria bacterium]|nr:low temperature requirement protein A [Pseudomonadota bacterium]